MHASSSFSSAFRSARSSSSCTRSSEEQHKTVSLFHEAGTEEPRGSRRGSRGRGTYPERGETSLFWRPDQPRCANASGVVRSSASGAWRNEAGAGRTRPPPPRAPRPRDPPAARAPLTANRARPSVSAKEPSRNRLAGRDGGPGEVRTGFHPCVGRDAPRLRARPHQAVLHEQAPLVELGVVHRKQVERAAAALGHRAPQTATLCSRTDVCSELLRSAPTGELRLALCLESGAWWSCRRVASWASSGAQNRSSAC